MNETTSHEIIEVLEACRERERAQTRFYRALAAQAAHREDDALSERLNELHADEQHHLSRLTARLLELGVRPRDLPGPEVDSVSLDEWEGEARAREWGEVHWYQGLVESDVDGETRRLFEEILESERRHRDVLGGKWMPA